MIEQKNLIAAVVAAIVVFGLLYLFMREVDSEGNVIGPSGLTKFLGKIKKK